MKIALASPPFPTSIEDGLTTLEAMVREAKQLNADIICFPESYLPGYPGMGYSQKDRTSKNLSAALEQVCKIAAENMIAIIIPMDWYIDNQLVNLAHVISEEGKILGYQTKNQLDLSEDQIWKPGTDRRVFEIKGIKFGITICHEGFRYPESVRWSALNGATIVFHPHFVGSNSSRVKLQEWGHKDNPYYEKAMIMRSLENTIYFASVNYSSIFPDSASAIIHPDGTCVIHEEYGRSGVIVGNIDTDAATGLLAKRLSKTAKF